MPDTLGTFEQRQHLCPRLAVAGRIVTSQGQQYVAGVAHRVGQALVIDRVTGLAEDHIKQDTGRLRRAQAIDQVGVHTARPGPLAEFLQARVIDGHQQDARIHRQGRQTSKAVV